MESIGSQNDDIVRVIPAISVLDESSREGSDNSSITPPRERSAGLVRKQGSLAVLIPNKQSSGHLGSSDSINQSPQSSPGYDVDASSGRLQEPHTGGLRPEKGLFKERELLGNFFPLKESYKDQRRKYRTEKKRVARELLSTLKDPTVVVLADWLKIRGTLKGWTKLWCVLKPGMLLLYKSSKMKSSHWTGTVLLNTCELIERPSKKNGFCFKLFHPLEQSIWATKGPKGENIGAMVQPLPSSHLIFRAPSQAAGKCWMDALELAVRCSSILIRSMTSKTDVQKDSLLTSKKWNESDYEEHFKDQDLDDASHTDEYEEATIGQEEILRDRNSISDSESEEEDDEYGTSIEHADSVEVVESNYVYVPEGYIGENGEQTEELAEENKSLIWFLLKQVRPGMDLSKVVLPTFILEPRSFLDKLSDYYYHADLLSKAVQEDDPYTRMKEVVRWYLSGFYKKPKGLKKPYNPILGEVFRCYWRHPNGSRTFYIAEQVSHHPPVSALYVTNRQEGFSVSATVLAKSKFYGNSISALLDGSCRLTLLPRGEDYTMNMPYAHCKGILMGTLSMELGGKVQIECEKTGYVADMEFKLKPFLSGLDTSNLISGKLRLGKETLAIIDGRWDKSITLVDKRTGEQELLWEVTPDTKDTRLERSLIEFGEQSSFESEKLWNFVSIAIKNDDQVAATEEKTILEEAQRASARERKAICEEWIPKFFVQTPHLGTYMYIDANLRPWDTRTDLYQYEANFHIDTKTKLKAPMVRTQSILSVEHKGSGEMSPLNSLENRLKGVSEASSSGELDETIDAADFDFVGTQKSPIAALQIKDRKRAKSLLDSIDKIQASQKSLTAEVSLLRKDTEVIKRRLLTITTDSSPGMKIGSSSNSIGPIATQSWAAIFVALILNFIIQWLIKRFSS